MQFQNIFLLIQYLHHQPEWNLGDPECRESSSGFTETGNLFDVHVSASWAGPGYFQKRQKMQKHESRMLKFYIKDHTEQAQLICGPPTKFDETHYFLSEKMQLLEHPPETQQMKNDYHNSTVVKEKSQVVLFLRLKNLTREFK